MARVLALYRHPSDPAEFNERYFATIVPLGKKIPGVRSFTVSEGSISTPRGGPAPFHLIAQLEFDSAEALQAGMSSPQGQAVVAAVRELAAEIVTTVMYDVQEV